MSLSLRGRRSDEAIAAAKVTNTWEDVEYSDPTSCVFEEAEEA